MPGGDDKTARPHRVVSFMMVMYALEPRHNGFVLAFACGCGLASAYGFISGAWPFGVVEAIWALQFRHVDGGKNVHCLLEG